MEYKPRHIKKKKGVRKETVAIILSIITGVAISLLVLFNFQMVSGFVQSMISDITGFFSGTAEEQIEEAPQDVPEAMAEDTPEEEAAGAEDPPETADDEEEEEEEEEAAGDGSLTIDLEIYEGPLYSAGDDICYYRIRALVAGEPAPQVSFSKDDSAGSLGPGKAQVNLSRDNKSYVLTAIAENSGSKVSDTMTLTWGCNRSPDIVGISLSSNTMYIGKQYDISVEASDLDGDGLSYAWSIEGGSISDSSTNPISWTTPNTPGDYRISVAVSDGKGNTSETSITAYVGEVVQQQGGSTNLYLPKKVAEGGYLEFGGGTYAGGDIYAGDSDGNKPSSGFISFDISSIHGSTVESASLTFSGAQTSGDPFSFLEMLWINVLDWGAEPITQNDFNLNGIAVAGFTTPGITCNVSKLREELQKAVNANKPRFQVRVHFSGPYTDGDSSADGWRYSQNNIKLNVTIAQ